MAKAKAADAVFAAVSLVKSLNPPTYKDMDCQAFMEYCVNQTGSPKINYAGSNDMFRNALHWAGTLSQAQKLGYLKPGVWLFIVEQNGKEPAKYKKDGLGNASHVGMYTAFDGVEVAHSSASRGGVFPSTLKNGWTHVGIPKDVVFTWQEGGINPVDQNQTNNLGGNYPTLRKGKKGESVKVLQQKLMALGYDVGKTGADGVFGSGTHRAVWAFQQKEALGVDGIAGKATWAKLIALTQGQTTAPGAQGGGDEIEGAYGNLQILDLPKEQLVKLKQEWEAKGYRTEISYG